MQQTSTFRRLGFKDPSVAQEVATKYGPTLNEDGTINWPLVRKGETVRLYRGNPVGAEYSLGGTPEYDARRTFAGKWFTDNAEKPVTYLVGYSKEKIPHNLEIQYVDIPKSIVENYRASKLVPDFIEYEPEDFIIDKSQFPIKRVPVKSFKEIPNLFKYRNYILDEINKLQ